MELIKRFDAKVGCLKVFLGKSLLQFQMQVDTNTKQKYILRGKCGPNVSVVIFRGGGTTH